MSRPEPKFSVGDEVIIVDQHDGFISDNNHVVLEVCFKENVLTDDDGYYTGYGYKVSNDPWNPEDWPYWIEKCLRLKPKQNDSEAFERFMKKLDLDKPANVPIAPKQLEEVH